jgi:hypothetical protein
MDKNSFQIRAWHKDFAPLVLRELTNTICPALQTGLIYSAPLALDGFFVKKSIDPL